jgi:hypothetical protein
MVRIKTILPVAVVNDPDVLAVKADKRKRVCALAAVLVLFVIPAFYFKIFIRIIGQETAASANFCDHSERI